MAYRLIPVFVASTEGPLADECPTCAFLYSPKACDAHSCKGGNYRIDIEEVPDES